MGHNDFIAMSGVLMLGKRTVCAADKMPHKVTTAMTNGWDEWYCEEFIQTLNDAELRFLILHEGEHRMRRHTTLFKHLYKVNPKVAGMALDFVINRNLMQYCSSGFLAMPAGGLYDQRFDNMNEVQIFNKIREMAKQNGPAKPGEEGMGIPPDLDGTGFDEHDWEGAPTDQEEQLRQARELDAAVRQGALAASKSGAQSDNPLIGELLTPQVRWEDELAEFINSACSGSDYSTWAKPNRRYVAHGIYMPSGIAKQVGEIVVAPDMSGSMWGPPLQRVMTELVALCDLVKPSRVHVLYWDTAVARAESYGGPGDPPLESLLSLSKPAGGGGTDASCVPNYMRQHGINPQACVVLTDGEVCGWGDWDWPVMWGVLDNKRVAPPVGRVIHITEV